MNDKLTVLFCMNEKLNPKWPPRSNQTDPEQFLGHWHFQRRTESDEVKTEPPAKRIKLENLTEQEVSKMANVILVGMF